MKEHPSQDTLVEALGWKKSTSIGVVDKGKNILLRSL